jgi:repressor LexA
MKKTPSIRTERPGLTPRQRRVLDYLRDYTAENGAVPTYAEMAEDLGYADKKSITQYLQALERKGYIRRHRYGHRALELLDAEAPSAGGALSLPLAGVVAAGQPLEAVENVEPLAIRELLAIAADREHFLLQVRGDSMIEDGIVEGDYVVVEQTRTARNGDTVVALLEDGTATLKRYYREKNRIRLQPANAALRPRYVRNLSIQGVVKGVIRSLTPSPSGGVL